MAKIKLSISSLDGKTQTIEIEGPRAQQLVGKRIGDELDGAALGLTETKLQIMGGSDKDGFPMRGDVHGGVRKNVLLTNGTGFKTNVKGKRMRKTVRGNVITDDIMQINLKTVKSEAQQPKL